MGLFALQPLLDCSEFWPQFSHGWCTPLAVKNIALSFLAFGSVAFHLIRKRASRNDGRKPAIKSAAMFNMVLVASIYLVGLNLAAAIWLSLKEWWSKHQFHVKGWVQIQFLAQAVAFLVFSLSLIKARRNKQTGISSTVKLWWIASSLLSLFVDILAVVLLLKTQPLPLDAFLSLLASPASLVLLMAACRPSIIISYSDELEQPLLNGQSEEKTAASERVTPYANAGLFSLATMSWMSPVVALGASRPLEPEDLPKLGPTESAETVHEVLKHNWEEAKAKALRTGSAHPSLAGSLVKTFWKQAAVTAVFVFFSVCSSYVGPYLIDDLVQYLSGAGNFRDKGLVLAFVFLATKVVENFCQRQWFFRIQLMGLSSRSALMAMVYRKGLRLSNPSRQSHSSGDIVNYMAVDVTRTTDFSWYVNDLWMLPLQIALALVVLSRAVGLASIAAIVTTCAIIGITTPFSRMQEKYEDKIMEAKDVRMRATTECLRSMKVLKLQAWEKAYLKKVEALRSTEYKWLKKVYYPRGVIIYLFWSSPAIVGIVTFATCIALNIPLTTGKVLSALSTFRVLQEPLSSFPDCIAALAQARVSLQRLSNFFMEEELQDDAVLRVPKGASTDNVAVEVEDGIFSWDGSPDKITLSNINFQAKEGSTIAVCGMVGSGKSSLLSCLLGEIPKLSGKVKLTGTTAYVGQTAWIQSGKIEDNVLFGSPMDKAKYDRVLESCQLKKDLEVLPYGDQTEIGERGINLSGGQKQRIQLARAVYQDADVYLLDDPFSAVDVQTGTQIFKEVVLRQLAGKTVILVTHQVEFLPTADFIIVLKDGRISQSGTYHELLEAGTDFSILVDAHHKAMEVVGQAKAKPVDVTIEEVLDNDEKVNIEVQQQDAKEDKPMTQLVQEEEREKGRVGLDVYWTYCTALYKGALLPAILAAYVGYQVLQVAGNWWIAEATPATVDQKGSIGSPKLVLVYAAFTFGGSLFVVLRVILLLIIGLGTSQIFFFNMLHSIFHAPMSFFDATPTGRILNRASTDQSALDWSIPSNLAAAANSIIQLLSVLVVMSLGLWQVLLVFFPVCFCCILLQRYYISSARELARLIGTQKAPIIHHYSETVAGVATVRGFKQEERFAKRNLDLIDNYGRPTFHSNGAMEWVSFRLELLSNIVFFVCVVLLVCFPKLVNPSLAGLAVSYGLNLNMYQSWFIWTLCNVENKIISVERIQQYCRIPSEAPWEIEEAKPPESWPHKGTVELIDLQIRYTATSPLVLHGVTCTFPGGKKVGVVGRTGSGKSTLIQAIFRIVEPAGGTIVIDGIDITRIGLHDLRSKLSIIPQDPTLFEGTVRYNLDPLGQYSDAEIWEALDKCQLGDLVRSKKEKLEASVSENGENWSVGQRQLFCLGRVMLKRARVMVLDEATASVDSATDGVIQWTIQNQFTGCTVITIAHRIPTVMDSDLVLVLSDGRVAEFEKPSTLLQRNSSHFHKLVSEYSRRSFNRRA